MKQQIFSTTGVSGIQTALVWTFEKYAVSGSSVVPEIHKAPTYIYVCSGQKSDCINFLKYSGVHDISEDSWNPADWYGGAVLSALSSSSESYQALESCLFPEFIQEELTTKLRFFGRTEISGTDIALLRLPVNTWRVDIYSESGITTNYPGDLLVPSEYLDPGSSEYPVPCISVSYGPGPELLNNPDEMYINVPKDRKESVTSLEYKRLLDELKSEKILAIEFIPHGLGKIGSINLAAGAWESQELPERNKGSYYLGKATLESSENPDLTSEMSGTLVDNMTGVLLGTRRISETPVKDLIYRESCTQNDSVYPGWNSDIVYRVGQIVWYRGDLYKSRYSDNIGNIPVTSSAWISVNQGSLEFPEDLDKPYSVIGITTNGHGKLYYPLTDKDLEMTGTVGTTENYIRFRVTPDPGYVLSGLKSFSYDLGEYVSNLVSERFGTYLMRIGPSEGSGGYNFCVDFDKIEFSVMTDYYVPGVNYYTFTGNDSEGNSKYRDIDVTYSTLNPLLTGQYLPECQDMIITCDLEDPYTQDDSSLIVSEEYSDLPKTLTLEYHDLLESYDVLGVTLVQYRGSSEVTRDSIDTYKAVSGGSLGVTVSISEATSHIILELQPKPIILTISGSENFDVSETGAKINIGGFTVFSVYSIDGSRPSVKFQGCTGISEVTAAGKAGLWNVRVYGISSSGKILIDYEIG